jgi:hypothetical protein
MSDVCLAMPEISSDISVSVTRHRQAETLRRRHGARYYAVQMSKGIMGNDQALNPDDREIVISLCNQLLHLRC